MCKVVSTSGLLWLMDSVVKNLPASAGDARDLGSIPGSGRSPGVRNGSPLQYSWQETSLDRGYWRATVRRLANSQTWLTNETPTLDESAVSLPTKHFVTTPRVLLSKRIANFYPPAPCESSLETCCTVHRILIMTKVLKQFRRTRGHLQCLRILHT